MKSSLAVIACLLYGTQAINLEDVELLSIGERMKDIDEKSFVSIGEMMKKREIMMIQDTEEKTNQEEARSLFGQVDFDSYNEDYKSVLNRVPINIKFENQSGMPEKIIYPKKKVEEPKPIIVAQAPKEEAEDEFTEEQKAQNEAFLEDKMKEYAESSSVDVEGDATARQSKDYALAMANHDLDKIKGKQIAHNRLAALKQQKVQAVQKLQQLEVKAKIDNSENLKILDTQWDKFCLKFKKEDYDKANAMWAKYNKAGAEFEPLEIRTKELYQKGFKFESIAQNETVQSAMEELDIAQTNLNNNIKNPDLMIKFIKTAQKTKQNLKSGEFAKFWDEPK